MMIKAKKKPVVVEVCQWDETVATLDVLRQAGMIAGFLVNGNSVTGLNIKTLEGEMSATKGDWIIKGVQGEFYPCKPDIFNETYELV